MTTTITIITMTTTMTTTITITTGLIPPTLILLGPLKAPVSKKSKYLRNEYCATDYVRISGFLGAAGLGNIFQGFGAAASRSTYDNNQWQPITSTAAAFPSQRSDQQVDWRQKAWGTDQSPK